MKQAIDNFPAEPSDWSEGFENPIDQLEISFKVRHNKVSSMGVPFPSQKESA